MTRRSFPAWRWAFRLTLALLLAGLAAGCAGANHISPALRAEAVPVDFRELVADPDRFKGETVILGGVILESEPGPEGTLLTILQTRTEEGERPGEAETSQGRFMALAKGFLDPELYAAGRQVTVAGKVEGKRTAQVKGFSYTYPLIAAEQVYLWPLPEGYGYPYYPSYYPYYYPWYPGPFFVPFFIPRHREKFEHRFERPEREEERREREFRAAPRMAPPPRMAPAPMPAPAPRPPMAAPHGRR
jgi:outer membrane lipoprotein